MKITCTDYHRYGMREVPFEEWSGDPRLPEILSQEECEADYDADKAGGDYGLPLALPSLTLWGLAFWCGVGLLMWLGVAWAAGWLS